jgi:hypothetical protein
VKDTEALSLEEEIKASMRNFLKTKKKLLHRRMLMMISSSVLVFHVMVNFL